MADPHRLGDLAEALLTVVSDALLDAGRPLGRAYISHAPPAWDACSEDQATVHVAPVTFRSSGTGRQQQTQLSAAFTVQVVRCVPVPDDTGAPPTALELGDSAVALLHDLAAVIYDVLASDVFGGCSSVAFGQVDSLGPSGGMAGWSWPITATI